MENNTQTQSPYISLEFCSCKQDFTQIPITRRDLGNTGTFINYSMVVAGTGSSEILSKYMENQGVSNKVNAFYKYKLIGNFGIFSYLFKKVEGKDNERAIQEVIFETAAIEIGGATTKAITTRLGIAMAGRILGSAVGSVIPVGGTIIGAVAGAWLANKVEEWWFSDEDKALESAQAENERIAQLEKAYLLKINHINDYLIRNNYVELRPLNESEAENLCKEASNLQSDYFKTIELMLSYKNYLSQHSPAIESITDSPSQETLLPPNTINSHRVGEIYFDIQVLDEYTRMPITNAKLQLQNVNLGQESITNTQGLATFIIKESEYLKPFMAKLIHKDYQECPILDRSIILNSIKRREKPLELRFKQKLDNFAVKEVKLEPRTYTLTDAHNEVITKNFYKVGDTLTLKVSFDENKVKENEIKWAYKVMKLDEIQMFHQQDSKDKNPQSTQTHYFQLDEIPNDTLQILQDSKTFFSNTPASTIKNTKSNESEPNNIYKGKTLEITIPENFENEKKLIALFAYKNEPNWKVCQIIRLNDYPQITIDCTLAETLRANAKNDEISRLGWGVSYICQRLWHDNPANAKELGELIYIDSRQEDFIDSIPNETMQTIVKDILPRVEMREFDKKYKKIAEESHREYQKMYREFEAQKERYTFAKEDDKDKTIGLSQKGDMINFYIELDWDEFYMQFPLMRGLEKEMLHIQIEPIYIQTTGMPTGKYKNQSKILTLNFLHSMQSFMCSKSDILYQALHSKTASNMQVVANLNAIASNPKGAKMPKSISKNIDSKTHTITALDIEYEDINHTIFSIKANDMSLAQAQKDMDSLTPKDLMRHHMQYYSISDIDFGLEYKLSFEEKSNQAIALYALSGKFQIYYVLDSFEVERINEKEIAIYPTQIKAYVDDSFDFRDQDHIFNDDGSIKELGQPVGAWDYNEMKFDVAVSLSQMSKYTERDDISTLAAVGATMAAWSKLESAISIKKYENYKKQNIYPIYNHDYQQTQKNFNLGCDFLVTSPTFKNIKIPKDLKFKNLFRIIVSLQENK